MTQYNMNDLAIFHVNHYKNYQRFEMYGNYGFKIIDTYRITTKNSDLQIIQ